MALSTTEIDAVVRETATILTGGWVQRVFQPTARAIILEIRAPGRTVRLLLSAEPGTARVHLLHSRPVKIGAVSLDRGFNGINGAMGMPVTVRVTKWCRPRIYPFAIPG